MSSSALALSARSLRVFIAASDPRARANLRALVLEAGHHAVDSTGGADIVLSLARNSATEDRLILIPPGGDLDQAGSLASDATSAQLDAALRAVAAGLLVRSPQLTQPGFA